jgi:D-xylose transport system permease protein
VTTPVEKSTNPATKTAAQTVGATTPHTIATGHEGTVRDQIDSYVLRIRGGEMGMLPALAGVVIITIVFFILTPYFLTKTNIANLMTQTAALMMLAVALTFVIILAEIDLSAGVTGGLAMAIFILLTNVGGWNWIAALVVALVVGATIGTFIGFMVAKIGVPSFVITLALFLGLQGVILVLLGNAGAYRIEAPAVLAIMNKSMPVWAGWLMLIVVIGISLLTGLYDRSRRVAAGMPVRPMSLLWARVAAWAIGGGLVVFMLSLNRSTSVIPIRACRLSCPLHSRSSGSAQPCSTAPDSVSIFMRLAATLRRPGEPASMSPGCALRASSSAPAWL